MKPAPQFDQAFAAARELHARGRLEEAERAYRRLDIPFAHRESVLRALAELYLQAGRHREAIATLVALTDVVPDRLRYYGWAASVLDELGRTDEAIGQYQRLLGRQPGIADAHFNLALLYKKARRYGEAIAAYREAARLGSARVQEVWSNLGVLYSDLRRADEAAAMYERALEIDPAYVPALFNRAGLFEEAGQRQEAVRLYERILEIEPGHAGALSRLAHAQRARASDDPLVLRLRKAIRSARNDAAAREELLFALGKVLDDAGQYDEAFAAFEAANALGRRRGKPYDRAAAEAAFDRLVESFSAQWIAAAASASPDAPVFICGMLRSGSTLVEQILAAHPDVTAGGELDVLPWLLGRMAAATGSQGPSRSQIAETGEEYLAKIRELFPGARIVTDKRPDNFLHLGLIKAMFPRARIVYTRRDPRDTCLSIYFQYLGDQLRYATDLGNIAHYFRQHERLMHHWQACFGDNIQTVDYDELVRSPESVLRPLLGFLGLEWDERCLRFREADALVKTASVWQVRDELHPRSSGRWRNYAQHIGELLEPAEGRKP